MFSEEVISEFGEGWKRKSFKKLIVSLRTE